MIRVIIIELFIDISFWIPQAQSIKLGNIAIAYTTPN